jgi:predicted DNA-binding transcriptional regulator AlpA
MPIAVSNSRELSDTQATNPVSAKFQPVSSSGHARTHDTESSPGQESAQRQVIEFGVHRGDADSRAEERNSAQRRHDERLLNARQVADKLGVSERFIRDHTTRRSPKIPAVKLGKLIRYRCADVDIFMAELGTLPTSNRSRFGV